jgi:hypothetical protein
MLNPSPDLVTAPDTAGGVTCSAIKRRVRI